MTGIAQNDNVRVRRKRLRRLFKAAFIDLRFMKLQESH